MCCKLSPWALPPRRRHRTTLSCPPFGARRCLGAADVGAGEGSPRRFRKIAVAAGVLWVWRIAKRAGPAGGRAAPRGRTGQLRAGPGCFFAFIFHKCLVLDLLLLCVSVSVSFSFLSPSLSSSPTFLTPVTNNTRTAYMKPTCKNIRRILFLSGSLICSSSRCRL